MNAEKFEALLKDLDACSDALEWAKGKDWPTVFKTCHRGDWLSWLFRRVNDMSDEKNLRLLTLTKGHCANTVRQLMRDDRSLKAVDTAIAFGEGRASMDDLTAAAAAAYAAAAAGAAVGAAAGAAYAAYAAAAGAAAAAAAYAAGAGAAAAAAAAAAAYAAAAAGAAAGGAAYDDAARTKNQKITADICRKYLPIEVWTITEI